MPDDQLKDYQALCGRLCMLAAGALHNGIDSGLVRQALQGQGHQTEDRLAKIVKLRHRTTAEIKLAMGRGVVIADVIQVTRECRLMAEQEYDVHLPIIAPSP